MTTVFEKPKSLTDNPLHYCPGCSHGIVHRIVAECIDELGLREKSIGVYAVGCVVLGHRYFNMDCIGASHGRAPAAATGIKRMEPDKTVFTYQGDGDLAAIGMAEIIHASARGENITVVFVNNGIYGMTGGQTAPTTLLGEVTTTSPYGRKVSVEGYPIKVAELLAQNEGSAYIARTSVSSPAGVMKTKKAVKKAFKAQQKKLGFSMVEILAACPTNWGKSPVESLEWLDKNMAAYYPLGEIKVKEA